MKRIATFVLCLSLALPVSAQATGAMAGQLSALKDLDDYFDMVREEELEPQALGEGEENEGAELDEQGMRTYEELKAWAEKNPEAFARMVAEEEAAYGQDDEDAADTLDASTYCADPNDPAFIWDAKAKKKKGKKGKGKGGRLCTEAVLKTNISVCCLLFVRTNLGLPQNPRSAHAKDYGSILSANGYCTTKATARGAPVGSVLVYSGGGSGHIEIKRGANSYWFGPTNAMPATEWQSKRRTLKGVYVKCGGGAKKKKK